VSPARLDSRAEIHQHALRGDDNSFGGAARLYRRTEWARVRRPIDLFEGYYEITDFHRITAALHDSSERKIGLRHNNPYLSVVDIMRAQITEHLLWLGFVSFLVGRTT
jgi:hypothetical protein